MPGGFKLSHPLLANMILVVNISKFFKWKKMYFMAFSVAHVDAWDNSFTFYPASRKYCWAY